MRRLSVLTLAAGLAACGSGASSPSSNAAVASGAPSAAPAPSATSVSTRVPPTPVPTADVSQSGCASDVPALTFLADADAGCYRDREVTVTGWLDMLPPLGFEPPGINPAWLAYPPGNVALWSTPPVGPDKDCPEVGPPCAWMFFHVDPASEVALGADRRWVTVTGHFFDPAAEECHYIADGYEGPLPPNDEARRQCRSQFVLTSLSPAAAPE